MMIRNHKIKAFLFAGLVSAAFAFPIGAAHAAPESDARIRTLVYNDNEVFRIVARSGFQTDVELALDETIDTLSIGDAIGWQITPASHRIFIKPLQKTGITNLSVITNRHTYQFELVASNPVSAKPDHAYVVRFYYPDSENASAPVIDRSRGSLRPISATAIPDFPAPSPYQAATPVTPPVLPGDVKAVPAPPIPAAPVAPIAPPLMPGDAKASQVPEMSLNSDNYNFNYTLTGPEANAPIKIYDDGKSTFFQFKSLPNPAINYSVVNADGTETPVPSRPDADGKVIIDRVAGKFTIRDGNSLVCVFNEQGGFARQALPAPATMPDAATLVIPPARP